MTGEPEATRKRGECLSGDPHQWCRWNDACHSCAPVADPPFPSTDTTVPPPL